MSRRILFAIRGKLGDSLVGYASVRKFIDAHPEDEVALLIRKDYARLLRGEQSLQLIAFNSRVEMMMKLLWLRFTAPAFDVLAVLWGFGNPIVTMARLVRARRKIYIDDRFSQVLPEFPPRTDYQSYADPAARVIRVFEPGFETVTSLALPGRAARHAAAADKRAVAIVPLADEPRRNLDSAALEQIVAAAAARHPGAPLWVLVNPRMTDTAPLLAASLGHGAEFRKFHNLDELVRLYLLINTWYGTDTGLFHLAVAMGIPTTVFFGPSQPLKACMPEQRELTWVRLKALGNRHCEETACMHPLCLHQTVANFSGASPATTLAMTPLACPLRAYPASALAENSEHEDPHH